MLIRIHKQLLSSRCNFGQYSHKNNANNQYHLVLSLINQQTMGKNSTGKEHSPDKEPHEKNRIQRKKIKKTDYSPKTTQDDVIEHLEATVSKLRTDVFLEKVHKTFRQLHSKRPHAYNRHDEYLFEKLCGNCLTPDHDELLLLCDICDDAYHSFCLVTHSPSL